MSVSDLASYFDRYARVAPSWQKFVDECDKQGVTAMPGYTENYLQKFADKNGVPYLTEVTADNYPNIYEALKEECEFRGVPTPACYVDRSGECPLGIAYRSFYTIHIEDGFHDVCTKKELRALLAHELKHLYQSDYGSSDESCEAEFDCDRAAVESTDYETILSYVRKAAKLRVKKNIPESLQGISLKFLSAFPNFAEYVPIAISGVSQDVLFDLDRWHPSPAARMKAMREHEAFLKSLPDLSR